MTAISFGICDLVEAMDNVESAAAAGTSAATVGLDKLAQTGVLYEGLAVMSGGAILVGLVLAVIATFVIERDYDKAAAFSLAGAVLTFFGFMHGEAIGVGSSPMVAAGYLTVAATFFVCGRFAVRAASQPEEDAPMVAGVAVPRPAD